MKVGEILFKRDCIDGESVEEALKIQIATKRPIGEILFERGTITEANLNEALSFQTSLKADEFENKSTFLEGIAPFNALDEEELQKIAANMKWRYFSPGEVVIRQGTKSNEFYIIKSGLAKVFLNEDGKETILGYLGEGDCFGEMSVLTDGLTTSNIQTLEYTLCLTQDKEAFLAMTRKYRAFYDYFHLLLSRRTNRIYTEFSIAGAGVTRVESFLYEKKVRDMMSAVQVFCKQDSSIGDTARTLIEKNAPTAIISNGDGRAKGLLGYNEIVRALALQDSDLSMPARSIMDEDYKVIDADGFFIDALHKMVKNNVYRLVVMDRNRALGVLTGFDLLRFRGREALSLLKNIDEASSYEQLSRTRSEVEEVLRALMFDNSPASNMCRIASEFNDKIARKVIQLAEAEMGQPPSLYAWLGLGSEGRKEQTLLTDQDNAIIYAGPASTAVEDYFKKFSEKVVHGLNQCGFPYCNGNIMATNPKYFGDLESWKERIKDWVSDRDQKTDNGYVDVYVFLDFRTVYGASSLEESLKKYIIELFQEQPFCLRTLSQDIVSMPIPLGFFKNFIVQKNGKYKNALDVKLFGMLPLVTCLKVLAFHEKIHETNTLDRIKALAEKGIFSESQRELTENAFETFMSLRIKNNFSDKDLGKDFGNYIAPASLTDRQKKLLKDAFLAVMQLQKKTQEVLRIEGGVRASI
jgi:CBS domain-containing protein